MKSILAALAVFSPLAFAHSCVDNSGNPVDWWFTYKLPDAGNDPNALNGYAYAYSDPNSYVFVYILLGNI